MKKKCTIPAAKSQGNFKATTTGLLKTLAVLAIVLITISVQAATTFTGAAASDFNLASNWSNGVPSAGNPGTIPSGKSAALTAVINIATSLTNNGTLATNNFLLTGSGTFTNNGLYYVGIEGYAAGFTTYLNTAASTVYYNDNANATVKAMSYGNLIISNAGAQTKKVLEGNVTVTGDVTLMATFRIVALDLQGFTLTSTTGTSTLTTGASDIIYLSGNNFPTNFATYAISASSTIDFNGTAAQIIPKFAGSITIPYGNITIENGSPSATKTLAATPLTIANDFLVSTGGYLDLGTNQLTGSAGSLFGCAGYIYISGANNFPTTFTTYTFGAASTVEFNGTVAQSVSAKTYGNLTFTNGGTVAKKTLAAATTIAGDVLINSGAALDVAALLLSGAASQTFTNNGYLYVGGANNFPTGFTGGNTLAAVSTVDYNLAGVQTVSTQNYGNLNLSTSGVKTLSAGNTGIAGNFTTSGTATVNTTTNATTVTYNGTGAQAANGAGAIYNNLVFNTTGPVTFAITPTISGAATFTNGLVSVTSGNFTFASGATTSGANNASHVTDNVTKLGTGAFIYPVGNATNYSAIGTNLTANASGMTASYTAGAGGTIAYTAPLKSRNYQEYWDLTPVSTATGTATIYWDGYNNPAISSTADLVVAHYISAAWKSEGATGVTGNTTAGSVTTSAAISTWSPFTLGSISATTVLPVTLTSFTATASGCTANLAWQTATETNSSYYAIEASTDGSSFTQTGKVVSKNNSTGSTYGLATSLGSGSTYFRLKMVDVDGVFTYSSTVAVAGTGACGASLSVKVSPNPTSNIVNIQGLVSGSRISLLNLSGQKLTELTATGTNQTISLSGYANGIYLVRVQKADGTVTNVKVVKD